MCTNFVQMERNFVSALQKQHIKCVNFRSRSCLVLFHLERISSLVYDKKTTSICQSILSVRKLKKYHLKLYYLIPLRKILSFQGSIKCILIWLILILKGVFFLKSDKSATASNVLFMSKARVRVSYLSSTLSESQQLALLRKLFTSNFDSCKCYRDH